MQARVKPLSVAKARKLLGALIVAGGTLLLLQQLMGPVSAAPEGGENQVSPADPAISHTHRDAPAPAPVKLLSA